MISGFAVKKQGAKFVDMPKPNFQASDTFNGFSYEFVTV